MPTLKTLHKNKTEENVDFHIQADDYVKLVRVDLQSSEGMDLKEIAGNLIEIALKICPDIDIILEESENSKYH